MKFIIWLKVISFSYIMAYANEFINKFCLYKKQAKIFIRIACIIILITLLRPYVVKAQESSPYKLQYKQTNSIKLNITIYPSSKKQKKSPAIIFYFGGGWKSGSIKQFKPHARYFAQRGLTSILVDYRVSSRNHTTPFDAVDDARDAIKFILQHSEELGIDSDNIVVSGGSAGGHLALISTFLPKEIGSFRPKAMVLFNPVIDTGPEGYGHKRLGDAYKKISPIDHIPDNPPPCILFYGTNDHIISEHLAKHFHRLYKAKGGICKLRFFKGQEHGFFNYQHRKYFVDTIREADKFLIREGILEGKPHIKGWMQNHN